MNFNGQWVPIEVMDTIVLLWLVAAVLIFFVLFRMRRSAHPKKHSHAKRQKNVHRKRNGRQN